MLFGKTFKYKNGDKQVCGWLLSLQHEDIYFVALLTEAQGFFLVLMTTTTTFSNV